MKIVFNTLGFFIIICLTVSCKKDKDSVSPVIVFSSPIENQARKVFDTLFVQAQVSDDVGLTEVTIKLLNSSLSPVQDSYVLEPSGKNFLVSKLILLYDVHLSSGNYFVAIQASDGTNTVTEYVKIFITGEPLKRTGFILFGKPAYNTLSITKIDSLYNSAALAANQTSDYSGSAVSSYFQDVYFAGKYSGKFNAIDIETGAVKWSIAPVITSWPYFNGVYSNGNNVFVSYFSNGVISYEPTGISKLHPAVGVSGYYPELVFDNGKYILMEQLDATSINKKVAVYYSSTGSQVQELLSGLDVIAFFGKNENDFFVFGNNDAGQGYMKIYETVGNGFWTPHALPPGKVVSAAQIDSANYLIGHSDGNIYQYTYTNNNFISILSGVIPNKLIYDPVKDQVIIGSSYGFKVYDMATAIGAPVQTYTSVDSVLNLEVLYNK